MRSRFIAASAAVLLGGVAINAAALGSPSGTQASAVSDAALAARVRGALHASYVNDAHIDVSVHHGTIVLSGLVEDARALIDALQAVQGAAGGHKVINEMTINKSAAH